MPFTIQNNKFIPVALPEAPAPRTKLMRLFSEAAQRHSMMVSAPAGYGKTVSTLLWLSESERQIHWITLDEYDNAPSIFYRLFCTAIASAQPENTRMAAVLESPGFSASPVEHTVELLAQFGQTEQCYALVLDDLHLITSPEILRSLPYMLRRMPHSFVTLLLTRNAPGEIYLDFVDKREAAVLEASALSFSPEEIRDYLAGKGRFLTREEAQAAHTFTGGWAMGVLAFSQGDMKAESKQGTRLLNRYIKRQIWNQLEEAQRFFLMQTSVVDELTPELAVRLTGRKDSASILNEFCATITFIARRRGGFVCHRLFLEFLREQAEESNLNLAALNKIAAEYYMEQGEHLTARRYAVRSEEPEMVLKSVYYFTQYTNPSLDEYVMFSQVFNREALSEDICEAYPSLYTAHLYLAYLTGDATATEGYLDRLYAHLPVIAADSPQILEMVILMLSLDHRVPFSKQIASFASLPPITYRNENQQGASISMQLPFLHRSNRDYYELSNPAVMEQLEGAFGLLLREHYQVVYPCLNAGFCLERNQTEQALAYAKDAMEKTETSSSPEMVFAAHMHLAAVYAASDSGTLLSQILAKAEKCIEEADAMYLHHNFLAYKTRLRLWECDKEVANAWLSQYFVTPRERIPLYKLFQAFTTVRAYMVLNMVGQAKEDLQKLLALAADFARPLDLAEANVLLACIQWAEGKRTAAQVAVEEALISMQPYGFIRVIADEGASVLPILKKINGCVQKSGYAGPLDKEYVGRVYLAAYAQSKRHKGAAQGLSLKPMNLSKQQKQVIVYLSQGMKNADIMEVTGLTIHTIKTHTRLAYEKLGVTNAMDAVLKAKELGVIE